MEFHEKLQELRKRKGLTQEELAQHLYVSRTAISKWESGRGFPSIDSLKGISKYFAVSLDDLLSGEELLAIAAEDNRVKESAKRDLLFGLLDCCAALLLFLPLFGQNSDGVAYAVSLLHFLQIPLYLKGAYCVIVFALVLFGILLLALQNCDRMAWVTHKHTISLCLSGLSVCLFAVSRQPYAAVFSFLFLMIKTFILLKRR